MDMRIIDFYFSYSTLFNIIFYLDKRYSNIKYETSQVLRETCLEKNYLGTEMDKIY